MNFYRIPCVCDRWWGGRRGAVPEERLEEGRSCGKNLFLVGEVDLGSLFASTT